MAFCPLMSNVSFFLQKGNWWNHFSVNGPRHCSRKFCQTAWAHFKCASAWSVCLKCSLRWNLGRKMAFNNCGNWLYFVIFLPVNLVRLVPVWRALMFVNFSPVQWQLSYFLLSIYQFKLRKASPVCLCHDPSRTDAEFLMDLSPECLWSQQQSPLKLPSSFSTQRQIHELSSTFGK